jgi:ABC-2 type transport system permease protein
MSRRICPLMRKEALHIRRDPRSLYLAIGLPVIMLLLFGYAITLEVRHMPVGIVDQDASSAGRALTSAVTSTGYFRLRLLAADFEGAVRALDDGTIKVLLVIPSGFAKRLARAETAPVQLLVDGSDSNSALIAMGYLAQIIQTFSRTIVIERAQALGGSAPAALPGLDLRLRVWFNPDLTNTYFIVPGVIAIVMMIMAVMLTSLTVAREWETGTMEQLIATPARPFEIVLGKLVPYFILGLVQLALVIVIGRALFGVPLKGNILFLLGVSCLFLICGLGQGLLLSVATRSQQLAFMLSFLTTLLPTYLLSGFVFPIASMPPLIRLVTRLVPARYYLEIIRGIFLKGTGPAALWSEIGPLALFALVIVVLCARKMKLRLE